MSLLVEIRVGDKIYDVELAPETIKRLKNEAEIDAFVAAFFQQEHLPFVLETSVARALSEALLSGSKHCEEFDDMKEEQDMILSDLGFDGEDDVAEKCHQAALKLWNPSTVFQWQRRTGRRSLFINTTPSSSEEMAKHDAAMYEFASLFGQLVMDDERAMEIVDVERAYAFAMTQLITRKDAALQEKEKGHQQEVNKLLLRSTFSSHEDTRKRVADLARRHRSEVKTARLEWKTEIEKMRRTQRDDFQQFVLDTAKTDPVIGLAAIPRLSSSIRQEVNGDWMDIVEETSGELVEALTLRLGASQMKHEYTVVMRVGDSLDYCKGAATISSKNMRVRMMRSLYSEGLLALILFSDPDAKRPSATMREFYEAVSSCAEMHFPDFASQMDRNREELESQLLEAGDFYVSRHSNLRAIHLALHLVLASQHHHNTGRRPSASDPSSNPTATSTGAGGGGANSATSLGVAVGSAGSTPMPLPLPADEGQSSTSSTPKAPSSPSAESGASSFPSQVAATAGGGGGTSPHATPSSPSLASQSTPQPQAAAAGGGGGGGGLGMMRMLTSVTGSVVKGALSLPESLMTAASATTSSIGAVGLPSVSLTSSALSGAVGGGGGKNFEPDALMAVPETSDVLELPRDHKITKELTDGFVRALKLCADHDAAAVAVPVLLDYYDGIATETAVPENRELRVLSLPQAAERMEATLRALRAFLLELSRTDSDHLLRTFHLLLPPLDDPKRFADLVASARSILRC